ncbi:MAG: molybdopterin-dependent oxidoreductase [Parcubacteria group bacterium]|nr:molybdopterin-dependent oxidoreductase [Parcubacteria group bacterium]
MDTSRRDFLKKCGIVFGGATVFSGSAYAVALKLVEEHVFHNKKDALAALKKSPFITVEKALMTVEQKTDTNVLGRPAAINIAGLSNEYETFVPSACWQCVSRCGAIFVVDTKTGKVKRIEGNPNLPRNNGGLCAKGRSGWQHLYDPDRLLYPMKRKNGSKRGDDQWERIGWEEALNLLVNGGEIAGRSVKGLKTLRDEGRPEYFMFQYGRMKGSTSTLIKDLFLSAYGTKTIGNHTTICEGGKFVAQELTWGKHYDVNDVVHTNFILNFGSNPLEAHTSHIPLAQRLMKAIGKNVPMYTFDVRLSNTAAKSTKWIPIKPGTDLAVVLAMANVVISEELYDKEFFEKWTNTTIVQIKDHVAGYTPEWAEKISGVPAQTIREIAVGYAKAKPGTIISYRGAVAHYNGVMTERAVIMLEALCGYTNRKGGRMMAIGAKWKNSFKKPEGHPKKLKVLDGEGYAFPNHHAGQDVLRLIKEGKYGRPEIYMAYCYNAAYANGNCRENIAILKDESIIPFSVAVDVGYGEGTKYADLVLPDANYLERWAWEDMASMDQIPEFYIRQPVYETLPGEASDFQNVVCELARRLGMGKDGDGSFVVESAEEVVRDACENTPGVKDAGAELGISGFEYMKRFGAWYDRAQKPSYDGHAKILKPEDMEGTIVDKKTGVIWKGKSEEDYTTTKDAYKNYVGQIVDGTPYKGFTPDKINKSGLLEIYSKFLEEKGFPALPAWMPIPEFENLKESQLVLTTYKVAEQTHSRTQGNWLLSELYHRNPAMIHPLTARQFKIHNGDKIRVTSEIGSIITEASLREGIIPGVIAISHHCGHWAHGRAATAGTVKSPFGREDEDIARIWWKDKGVHPNWIIPNKGDPIGGQQRWMDTIVTIEKV